MIDFHSHILPAMDDGSKNTDDSLKMLSELKSQGVTDVVLTPHFYANSESVSDFLLRRQASYNKLSASLSDDFPGLHQGAEVRYYEGISRLADLKKLCIEGTDLLLLEMPFSRWTDFVIKELYALTSRGDITVVLAHIERYIKLNPQALIDEIINNGALIQINASFVSGFLSKRKAIDFLRSGRAHFIGSDCHDPVSRPPDIKSAVDVISKKLGNGFINDLVDYGNEFFCKNKEIF